MFLGIDIGSSFIKSAFLDLERKELYDISRVKTPYFLSNRNLKIKEYSPDELYYAVRNSIEQRMSFEAIEGILISTQMHGFILIGENGRPVTNYVSWQDERAFEVNRGGLTYLDDISKIILPHIKRPTGVKTSLNLSICPLYYMAKNGGVPNNARFMMMGDYLAYRLTGNIAPCHITNAASSGMLNIEKGTWSREIFKIVGAGSLIPPEVAFDVAAVGKYKDVKLYTPVGDQQASLLGGGEYGEEDLLINIATGSQVSVVSDFARFGNFDTRPYFNGKYILCEPDVPAGRNIDTLIGLFHQVGIDIYGSEADSSYIWRRINAILGTNRIMGEPLSVNLDFYGLNGRKGGSIGNIYSDNLTIENIILGSFASLAENLHSSAFKITDLRRIKKIILTGGLVQNSRVLQTMIANRFGKECVTAAAKEEALYGLLKLAKSL